jgi:cytochrome c-type biogenesis protein CcmH
MHWDEVTMRSSRAHLILGPGALRLVVAPALIALVVFAACSGREPTLEERAVALDRQLMCPVCEGQTLDESRAQLAQQMKHVVREKLAAGENEEQIKAYFADPARYGIAVLASPPASGFNLTLWALPPALAAAGAAGVVLILRGMRRSALRAVRPEAADTASLGEYLGQVDQDLRLSNYPALSTSPLPAGDGCPPTAGAGEGEGEAPIVQHPSPQPLRQAQDNASPAGRRSSSGNNAQAETGPSRQPGGPRSGSG